MNVYLIDDRGGFQVDCAAGSFEFSPSRLRRGNVELRECYPETAKDQASGALVAGLIWAALRGSS